MLIRRSTAEHAWFDKLTMSAHPEPVEGCGLRDLGGEGCVSSRHGISLSAAASPAGSAGPHDRGRIIADHDLQSRQARCCLSMPFRTVVATKARNHGSSNSPGACPEPV